MYVCFYDCYYAKGKTIQEAYDRLLEDWDASFSECEFYSLGNALAVEIRVVEVESITEKKKGTK